MFFIRVYFFFFFKQKTAYEMRISDWSSDVCSSDLLGIFDRRGVEHRRDSERLGALCCDRKIHRIAERRARVAARSEQRARRYEDARKRYVGGAPPVEGPIAFDANARGLGIDDEKRERSVPRSADARRRSEEHTSELQSLMRISYAVFCLKKK